jgi:putative NADH-flavin reductase
VKLTIIGATGGVGRQLLGQALDAGHDVTAMVRDPGKLPPDVLGGRAVRIVTADLVATDPQVLESAVAGADAVLSALGPHNNRDAGIAADGTATIITAMWGECGGASRSAPRRWPPPPRRVGRTRPGTIPGMGC